MRGILILYSIMYIVPSCILLISEENKFFILLCGLVEFDERYASYWLNLYRRFKIEQNYYISQK